MRASYRLLVTKLGSFLVCLGIPGFLVAADPVARPAGAANQSILESEVEVQQRLEQEALAAERRRIQAQEQEQQMQLVVEYILVGFEPDDQFVHAGNCPLSTAIDGEPQPGDIAVLIEGTCLGRVGETIQVTLGNFEVSVDVVDAETKEIDVEDTTAAQPKIISIPITTNAPSAPNVPTILE